MTRLLEIEMNMMWSAGHHGILCTSLRLCEACYCLPISVYIRGANQQEVDRRRRTHGGCHSSEQRDDLRPLSQSLCFCLEESSIHTAHTDELTTRTSDHVQSRSFLQVYVVCVSLLCNAEHCLGDRRRIKGGTTRPRRWAARLYVTAVYEWSSICVRRRK